MILVSFSQIPMLIFLWNIIWYWKVPSNNITYILNIANLNDKVEKGSYMSEVTTKNPQSTKVYV